MVNAAYPNPVNESSPHRIRDTGHAAAAIQAVSGYTASAAAASAMP
jgi:hypothetical protein